MTEIVLKPELLKNLQKVLVEYVYDQQTSSLEQESQSSGPASDDAYGVWKPE